MKKRLSLSLAAVMLAAASLAQAAPLSAPPQGTQSDTAFAASYAGNNVSNVSATSQHTSCYSPEVAYFDGLTAANGYVDGGGSLCNGQADTGEDLGPYATQN